MYGKSGLLQFQYAIPWEHAREGTIAILGEVAKSGLASFLAVLKAFGDVPSPGLMSFPQPGITLALDFPIKAGTTFPLVERLADMTREFGGRLYPAKDAAMTAAQFQTFYPQWEQLARFQDPVLTSSFWERVTGSAWQDAGRDHARYTDAECASFASGGRRRRSWCWARPRGLRRRRAGSGRRRARACSWWGGTRRSWRWWRRT